jgi:hypothetical protein
MHHAVERLLTKKPSDRFTVADAADREPLSVDVV